MTEQRMIKYPRTPHLEGSRMQPGDEDLSQIPFAEIAGRNLAVEEKCDGANSAISFSAEGELLLQSRGHYLTGGYREREFNLMKQWAAVHRDAFYRVLGSRYIMYGEWMYAKHSIYYDALPHYFLEFDVLDRQTGKFLDTPSRQKLLTGVPVVSVPVLARGRFTDKEELLKLLGPSRFSTSGHMEGLYLKVEENGQVVLRLKYVRVSFAQDADVSGTHWLDRPVVPNGLCVEVEKLFT